MTLRLIHPEGVVRTDAHHQVSVARGSTMISMAGQVSWDADGRLVGAGDLAAQAEQAYLNVAAALRGPGATTDDLTGVTVYVVGLGPDTMPLVLAGVQRAAERLGATFQHPGTYVGVTSLFDPDYVVEIQGTAVVD